MVTFSVIALFAALRLFLMLAGSTSLTGAVPVTAPLNSTSPSNFTGPSTAATSSSYWLANIKRQGTVAFGNSAFKIYRNVQDYGAKGMLWVCIVLEFTVKLDILQATVLQTTPQLSMRLSPMAVDAAKAVILQQSHQR